MKLFNYCLKPVLCLALLLGISSSFVQQVNAEEKEILYDEFIEIYENEGNLQIYIIDSNISDEELLLEIERLENEKVREVAQRNRTTITYDVKLTNPRNVDRSTGFRVAGGQPVNGTNFGSLGGSFGYIEGDSYSPVTLSFGISGYGVSFGLGVGRKASAGVNGFNITAPKNKFVKLYVNKTYRVVIYDRWKVYRHNGVVERYGWANSLPKVAQLVFDVR